MPDEAKRKLSVFGYYLIETQPDKRLSAPIASHPDMIMCYHKGTLISSCDYCDSYPYIFEDIHRFAPDVKMIFTDDTVKAEYPHDARYNALFVGSYLFCKADSVSGAILDYAEKKDIKLIPTKQGYPACTTLPLSDKTALSADPGILKALSENGICAIKTENGGIALPPYEYGFIGGTAGICDGKLFFIGDYTLHASADTIASAARAENLSPVSLCSGELLDLGRIIFIDSDVKYNG